MNRRIASLLFLAGFFTAFPAKARVYDLYRADAPKGTFCSAIGGACVADPDLVSGLLQNPASLSAGLPAWNFDFDYNFAGNSEPGAKSSNSITEGTYFAGIALNRGEWGVGLAAVGRKSQTETSVDVTDSQGLTQKFPLEAINNFGYHAAFMGQKSYNGVSVSMTRRMPTGLLAVRSKCPRRVILTSLSIPRLIRIPFTTKRISPFTIRGFGRSERGGRRGTTNVHFFSI